MCAISTRRKLNPINLSSTRARCISRPTAFAVDDARECLMRYMLEDLVSVGQVTTFVLEVIYGGAVILPVANKLASLGMATGES
jgi:hypothetical protein